MSVFGKLFGAGGGKAGKGGPTPQEAIQRLRDTEEMLSKKQEFLEKKIEQELTAAKKHGTKNKRGESTGPPLTPLAGLHLRQTCSSVCSDPGTLTLSDSLLCLPGSGTLPHLTPFSVSRSLGLLHHHTVIPALSSQALPTLRGPFRP